MTRRGTTTAALAAGLVLVGAGIADAAWNAPGSGSATAAAQQLAAPAGGNASSTTSSSVTIAVTGAPASGPAPSAYRVDRGSQQGVCTITGGLGSCTDSGLQPGTTYSYNVYSLLGGRWVSAGALSVAGTTAPVAVSQLVFSSCSVNGSASSCPASGGAAVQLPKANQHGGSWTAKVTLVDANGIATPNNSGRPLTVTIAAAKYPSALSATTLTIPSGAAETSTSFTYSTALVPKGSSGDTVTATVGSASVSAGVSW